MPDQTGSPPCPPGYVPDPAGNGGFLPDHGIGGALVVAGTPECADQPEPAPAGPPGRRQRPVHSVPPVDPGNVLLGPVQVGMDLYVCFLPTKPMPANCTAVVADVLTDDGRENMVVFTIRTTWLTATVFWPEDVVRSNIDLIRKFVHDDLPQTVPLPGDTTDDRQPRLMMNLKENDYDSEITVELDADHALMWADILERALAALTGSAVT